MWEDAAVIPDHRPGPAEADRRVRSKLRHCLREAISAYQHTAARGTSGHRLTHSQGQALPSCTSMPQAQARIGSMTTMVTSSTFAKASSRLPGSLVHSCSPGRIAVAALELRWKSLRAASVLSGYCQHAVACHAAASAPARLVITGALRAGMHLRDSPFAVCLGFRAHRYSPWFQ